MLSSRSTAKTIFLNLDSYSHQQPLTKTMEYESNSWDKEKPNSICKSRKKSVKDKKISNRDETTNSVKSNLVCGKGGDTTYYNTNNEESSNLKKSKIIPGKGGPKKVHSRHPSGIYIYIYIIYIYSHQLHRFKSSIQQEKARRLSLK